MPNAFFIGALYVSAVKPVKYELDMQDIFGDFPEDDEALADKVAQSAIDKIRKRTQDGLDKDGKPFAPYSQSYINSLAFKAAGKSPKEINMTLFGDMLGLMDIVEKNGSKRVLGWNDDLQNAKAYNHTTGDTVPKRDFFGLTGDEVSALRNEFQDDVSQAIRSRSESQGQPSEKDSNILDVIDFIKQLQDEL